MSFDGLPSQGLSCTWGVTAFNVTSLQYNASTSGEIDITGMDASVLSDPNWSSRKLVYKSVEYGVVDPGEVQIEFFANASAVLLSNSIGAKRLLSFSGEGESFSVSFNAILTQFSVQMQLGEYVKGNCTFKLTEI